MTLFINYLLLKIELNQTYIFLYNLSIIKRFFVNYFSKE